MNSAHLPAIRMRLAALPLPGLRPTSLGSYLATLGVLRLTHRRWPGVRLAWRDDIPHLVGGPEKLDSLLGFLVDVARDGSWTPYELSWQVEQKKATKTKSGEPITLWRATADEDLLRQLDAHIIAGARLFFNPLLGSGGNAGKRKFSDGWSKAKEVLQRHLQASSSVDVSRNKKAGGVQSQAIDVRQDLSGWLVSGDVTFLMEKLQAACWFSDANKLFNSGQTPAREGQITPWAMLLACEGLVFFAGGASRRLGAAIRTQGAFPFVTAAAAPTAAGEAGRDRGEVWAPIWNRPATLAEIEVIFSRGRAELGGRGATTPAAFAAAIRRRGTDAGIAAFMRFTLGQTTSANTFEPRLMGRIAIPSRGSASASVRSESPSLSDVSERDRGFIKSANLDIGDAVAETLERAVALIERLPRDDKKGARWIYRGLRGPVEVAVVRYAAEPEDSERARTLVDAMVSALDRVDRNRAFRERGVRWQPLPLAWLPHLLDESAAIEARLAAALVSAFPAARPFTLYRFGAVPSSRLDDYAVPETAPASWIWKGADLCANLTRTIDRFTLDLYLLSKPGSGESLLRREGWYVAPGDVEQWLAGAVDEMLLAVWLSRLALFDWAPRYKRNHYGAAATWLSHRPRALRPLVHPPPPVSGAGALHALCLPFLDQRPVTPKDSDLLDEKTGARTQASARKLVALLRTGQVPAAFDHVRSRYAMARSPLIQVETLLNVADPARLLASLLMPVKDRYRADLISQRWLRPSRSQGDLSNA